MTAPPSISTAAYSTNSMPIPRTTLEQWQVLQAIVECGSLPKPPPRCIAVSRRPAPWRFCRPSWVWICWSRRPRMVFDPGWRGVCCGMPGCCWIPHSAWSSVLARCSRVGKPEVRLAVDGLSHRAVAGRAGGVAAQCPATRLAVARGNAVGRRGRRLAARRIDLALVTWVPPGFRATPC